MYRGHLIRQPAAATFSRWRRLIQFACVNRSAVPTAKSQALIKKGRLSDPHSGIYCCGIRKQKPSSGRKVARLAVTEGARVHFRYKFLTPNGASVSLRFGHATALTVPRTVIHYRSAASLPPGGSLKIHLRKKVVSSTFYCLVAC